MKFDFNDLLIVPAVTSSISTRKDVLPYYVLPFLKESTCSHLPIIVAPMDTVISKENEDMFNMNGINYCIPRGGKFAPYSVGTHIVMSFQSYSLDEFIDRFINTITYDNNRYILIDIANGHMNKLIETVKEFKAIYKDYYKLMVGNIAHPETYELLSLAGADYVRAGIGNGNGCLTTQQLGIGYPMASLVQECYTKKRRLMCSNENAALIVADGGMKGYSDIIKALGLGADYVMIGSIFNLALESAGPTYFKGIKLNQYSSIASFLFKNGFKLTKKFRGMSTKEVQKTWNKGPLKTSEGVVRYRPVEYTIDGWTTNFIDYLKSAMSYTDKRTVSEFVGSVNYELITTNAFARYNK